MAKNKLNKDVNYKEQHLTLSLLNTEKFARGYGYL